jgi:hypothetical protein
MKRLSGAISPRCWKVLRYAAWAALIVLLLASLPFLFGVLSRGIDWITGLFPNPAKSWEALLWLR